ncbi:hypothetical protein M413DRAFT_19549 [Hebeloma cylindrosporum]|uniref:NAD-dependent epimerase/dehydratase domain-containing protein n=1 Tax=Hebeloma cylindrosporum TaxID=76867 RepID=A0A0C2YFB7_HEBCY|nr:hypothetical protein M413DRAFT_19549 [Hebeloma cylindrosporum h7]
MKLAVTGASGSVGKRVVKLALERGHSVIGTDTTKPSSQDPWTNTSKYVFKTSDLTNFDNVLEVLAGCDAVINLAGHPNPLDYKVKTHNNNVVISWNVLRACAELGINRIAQASSVNVIAMAYSKETRFHYFPIDEDHPCEPDEPYGLAKLICEMQADVIVRRYKSMRIASLRFHLSVPDKSVAQEPGEREKDLWGYVQEDSVADAFLLAIEDTEKWSGHERFFIVSSQTAYEEDTMDLIKRYWPGVPIKKGKTIVGNQGLFDCSKAAELLGWQHKNGLTMKKV